MEDSNLRGTSCTVAPNTSSAECAAFMREGVTTTIAAPSGLSIEESKRMDAPRESLAAAAVGTEVRARRQVSRRAATRVQPLSHALQRANGVHDIGTPSSSKRAQRDRGPNWSLQEISTLIQAKRDLFFEELDAKDGRHLMRTEASKWIAISAQVMKVGFSSLPRDGPACKEKWTLFSTDYKPVVDFFTLVENTIKCNW